MKRSAALFGLVFVMTGYEAIAPELFSVIVAIMLLVWVLARPSQTRVMPALVVPLFLFILVGLLGAYRHAPIDVLRDLWYAGKAVVVLVLGYVLGRELGVFRSLVNVVSISGIIAACFHLSHFLVEPELLSLSSVEAIRATTGGGNSLLVLPPVMLAIGYRHKRIPNGSGPLHWTAAVLCTTAFLISFSRTLWLIAIIMLGVIFSYKGVSRGAH